MAKKKTIHKMNIKHIGAEINKMSQAQIAELLSEWVPEVKTYINNILSGVHANNPGGDGDADFDDGVGALHDSPTGDV